MLACLLIMKEKMKFIPTNNNIVGFNNLISKAMIQHFDFFFGLLIEKKIQKIPTASDNQIDFFRHTFLLISTKATAVREFRNVKIH